MPRFAANLTMLFTEYPVLERYDRAAAAGFQAVEFLFPYDEDVQGIKSALERNGLTQILFNLPAGDWAKGERGIANDPRRVNEFRDGVRRALDIAALLGVTRINCLAGITLPDVPVEDQWATLRDNLAFAAEAAQEAGVRQLVEPINPYDIPGFFLNKPSRGFELLDEVGHPNLWLEYDIYHAQRTEGNLTATLREKIGRIAHIQIADSPGRNEPGTGEINYQYVFSELDKLGYDGWIGLEYRPSGSTEASLSWLRDWGYWS
ncbi:MAG TPA: hydroxypyruvate isomerase [Thermomicrobiales bacterium]